MTKKTVLGEVHGCPTKTILWPARTPAILIDSVTCELIPVDLRSRDAITSSLDDMIVSEVNKARDKGIEKPFVFVLVCDDGRLGVGHHRNQCDPVFESGQHKAVSCP